jgi:hypothetical protein
MPARFQNWCDAVSALPRKQTRVMNWPIVTVFSFIAQPQTHLFLKPLAMKDAARRLDFDLRYRSRPNWDTYAAFLELGRRTKCELRGLQPRDMIDVQSCLWVLGSTEYQ